MKIVITFDESDVNADELLALLASKNCTAADDVDMVDPMIGQAEPETETAPEPEPETAPEPEAKPKRKRQAKPKKPTLAELRQTMSALIADGKADMLKQLFADRGITKVSDLDKADYEGFMADLQNIRG